MINCSTIRSIFSRIRNLCKIIVDHKYVHLYLIQTIIFNFRHLPVRQAIYLPIFIHKPDCKKFRGKIRIDVNVETGMIQLGEHIVSIYPNTGFHLDGSGTIIFKGKTRINSGSYISLSENAVLSFGKNFHSTYGLKIVCYKSINFGDNILVGWETSFFDTDFHKLVSLDGKWESHPVSEIIIGDNCWFAHKCTALKGTHLPARTCVSSHSLLNKNYSIPQNCLLGGIPAQIIRRDVKFLY